MDILNYPAVGFHFAVAFELFPQLPADFKFQEVTGLSVSIGNEAVVEGGENRFVHKLPTRTEYTELELKRGVFVGSGIVKWCTDAVENFDYRPTNATILLLNELHLPIMGWYVVNAYPVQWSIGSLDANKNEVLVESIKLNYNYFKTLRV